MLFHLLISLVILQRIIELWIARKNRKWAIEQGGIEFGAEHYKYIVFMHASFFLSLYIEHAFNPSLHHAWFVYLTLFLFVQLIRFWIFISLGRYWNTRVIVIPHGERVSTGPYRFFRHPNYFVVAAEIFLLPMIFEAYFTAVLFSLINFFLIRFIRIPVEERALRLLAPTTKDNPRLS